MGSTNIKRINFERMMIITLKYTVFLEHFVVVKAHLNFNIFHNSPICVVLIKRSVSMANKEHSLP